MTRGFTPFQMKRNVSSAKDKNSMDKTIFRKKPLFSSGTGFTLLEILVTLLVFTVGVVSVVAVFANALVTSADAENTRIAMNLAQRRMEEIRNSAFGDIENEDKENVDIDVDGDGNNDFPGFQREVEVTAFDPGLKEVAVNVYWTLKGGEISTSLETYISGN